jgi:predicted acylesterase/phospholipase RssA
VAVRRDIRIALTISGAVSLGAYEGGALAALLTALQAVMAKAPDDPPIRLDAIGGASAGSITALLTARCLLAGLDPVEVMRQSWVIQPSLRSLRGTTPHSPLSIDQVRDSADGLLDPKPQFRGRPSQPKDIEVMMALGTLRGLNYQFARLRGDPIDSSTFLDWRRFTFHPQAPKDEFVTPKGASALDFALASGANALGFPPVAIRRDAERHTYEEHGVTNFPPQGWFWYTDGGTINNEPLGQTLELVNEADGGKGDPLPADGYRLLLLIHPHPDAPVPAGEQSWSDPSVQPAWTRTLIRSFQLQTTQSLYNDLRHVEKTNSRVDWTNRLVSILGDLATSNPDSVPRLREFIRKVQGEKNLINARAADAIEGAPDESVATAANVRDLVEQAVGLATGYGNKSEVALEVISPLILPEASVPDPKTQRLPTVADLLAGEFLRHFGGFVEEKLRSSDFALGYRSMREWMNGPKGLEAIGLDHDLAAAATTAVDERWDRSWDTKQGKASLKNLPPPPAQRRQDLRHYRSLRRHILHVMWHEGVWHHLLRRGQQIFHP